jgi:hypothetical protein
VVDDFVVVGSSVKFPLRRVFRHAGRDVTRASTITEVKVFLDWHVEV